MTPGTVFSAFLAALRTASLHSCEKRSRLSAVWNQSWKSIFSGAGPSKEPPAEERMLIARDCDSPVLLSPEDGAAVPAKLTRGRRGAPVSSCPSWLMLP